MGRALAAAAALLVLCFGVLGGVIYFTRDEEAVAVDASLAESITRAIAEAEQVGEPVALADITPFSWDQVLIFPPRTSREQVNKALGFEFEGDLPYDAESSEIFVFVDEGRLERFADYRGRGRFAELNRPVDVLTPREAVFEVEDLVATPRR